MAGKGVAISQIILLVLGIIVLSVVIYLLYSNFTTTTSQVEFQKCRAAATNACTACSIANGGSTLNCPGNLYLRTEADKQCAYQGSIAGASADQNKDPTGKVTYEVRSDNIKCELYIGGVASNQNNKASDQNNKASDQTNK